MPGSSNSARLGFAILLFFSPFLRDRILVLHQFFFRSPNPYQSRSVDFRGGQEGRNHAKVYNEQSNYLFFRHVHKTRIQTWILH